MKSTQKMMVNFVDAQEKSQWIVVNDGVMGGLSQSQIDITADRNAVFRGNISLENNGGFASVRRSSHDYELAGYSGVKLRVKGDGRKYQFRLTTSERFDGIAYQAEFQTQLDKWIMVKIPFKSFKPTSRGRIVPGAPELQPERIKQIGFLIADKQAGIFRIEIDWVQAYRLSFTDRPAEGTSIEE